MIDRDQLKQFIYSLLDLHRDSFVELLQNPEFLEGDLETREKMIDYVNRLFKREVEKQVGSWEAHLH